MQLNIVVDLATQNVISEKDHPEEHKRQMEAVSVVSVYRHFNKWMD
ncbi:MULTISPECIES: hypothetical protein [unclassified Bradyrhizobium]|nr:MULTISPECIES: hypothetical protein [unclassified Bradyrhizobium]MCK7669352.1 hypothetical protein [Bradyrhizobium sp. 2S1]